MTSTLKTAKRLVKKRSNHWQARALNEKKTFSTVISLDNALRALRVGARNAEACQKSSKLTVPRLSFPHRLLEKRLVSTRAATVVLFQNQRDPAGILIACQCPSNLEVESKVQNTALLQKCDFVAVQFPIKLCKLGPWARKRGRHTSAHHT